MARVLVGGVATGRRGGLGRRVVGCLRQEPLGQSVVVELLPQSGAAAAERIAAMAPGALILVGAEARGQAPGTVARRRLGGACRTAGGHAGGSDVGMEGVLHVASRHCLLPARTVVIGAEPVVGRTSGEPTEATSAGLAEILALVRTEVRRMPLLAHADDVRAALRDGHVSPSEALDAVSSLLGELAALDREGRWGRAFAERDRLRIAIGAGQLGDGMTYLDWGLWWGLIEELDALQGAEAGDRP